MTDSLDLEIQQWVAKSIAISKGDVTGHPFHGNQYAPASSGQGVLDHAVKVANARLNDEPNSAEALRMAQFHHEEANKAMTARDKAFSEGNQSNGEELNRLVNAHLQAEKTWRKASDYGNPNYKEDTSKAVRQTQSTLNHDANQLLPADNEPDKASTDKFMNEHFAFGTVGFKKDGSLAGIVPLDITSDEDEDEDFYPTMSDDEENDDLENPMEYYIQGGSPETTDMTEWGEDDMDDSGDNSEIAKGDVMGHPFHGNQYQASAHELANRVNGFAHGVSKNFSEHPIETQGNGMNVHKDIAEQHRSFAAEHMAQCDALMKEVAEKYRSGTLDDAFGRAALQLGMAHSAAAQAHLKAAEAHDQAANEVGAGSRFARGASDTAVRLTNEANKASIEAARAAGINR